MFSKVFDTVSNIYLKIPLIFEVNRRATQMFSKVFDTVSNIYLKMPLIFFITIEPREVWIQNQHFTPPWVELGNVFILCVCVSVGSGYNF